MFESSDIAETVAMRKNGSTVCEICCAISGHGRPM